MNLPDKIEMKDEIDNVCSIVGCNGKCRGLGYCNKHYQRFKRYGDASILRHKSRGEALKEFNQRISIETDNCILWESADKYGHVFADGKTIRVHRLALLRTIGNPPQDKPYALHSCNNRHCFNPRHLRWGDQKENVHDRIKDGTANRGENCPLSKLTANQVIEIYQDKRPYKEIGKDYNICCNNVYYIKSGKSWSWLTKERINQLNGDK